MKMFVALVLGLGVGLAGGYFIGFDHGFEGAAAQGANVQAVDTVGSAAQAMANLIGMWRSTQDVKFTREFRNDGVVIDRYEGSEPPAEGLWLIFTKDIPDESFAGPYEEGATYLSMAMSESERLYFKIASINADTLELVFLDGGVLRFSRVQ